MGDLIERGGGVAYELSSPGKKGGLVEDLRYWNIGCVKEVSGQIFHPVKNSSGVVWTEHNPRVTGLGFPFLV